MIWYISSYFWVIFSSVNRDRWIWRILHAYLYRDITKWRRSLKFKQFPCKAKTFTIICLNISGGDNFVGILRGIICMMPRSSARALNLEAAERNMFRRISAFPIIAFYLIVIMQGGVRFHLLSFALGLTSVPAIILNCYSDYSNFVSMNE